MTTEMLTALKGSIAKWQAIVNGEIKDDGSNNCPLCKACGYDPDNVTARNHGVDCTQCPVFGATGKWYCRGSPYQAYVDYLDDYPDRLGHPSETQLAQAELDFLKSLLPEGETV